MSALDPRCRRGSTGVGRERGSWGRCVLTLLALAAAACGGHSAETGNSTETANAQRTGAASERTRLLAHFRTRQERQGFPGQVSACLVHDARRLPLDVLRDGGPSESWILEALTTTACGPPSVKEFVIRGLEQQFRAQPRSFPRPYRSCLVAGVRRLPPREVSRLVIAAVNGRTDLSMALTQIAHACQRSVSG